MCWSIGRQKSVDDAFDDAARSSSYGGLLVSPGLMRWIDKSVGEVLVRLFGRLRRPGPHLLGRVDTMVVSKYLGIGSLLMATPLLQLLRSRFPKARIIVVSFRQNEALLKSFPFVDAIVAVDRGNLF